MIVCRKIYYNKLDGEIIEDTGELEGDVRETEYKEDVIAHNLLMKNKESEIDFIKLELGEYEEEFKNMKSMKVNTETREIEFIIQERTKTDKEKIVELENKLLISEGVI